VRLARTRRYLVAKNLAKRVLPGRHVWPGPVDDTTSAPMQEARPVVMEWPSQVAKPFVGLVQDVDYHPYWTRYRSFLEANDVPHQIYDIHRSDWLEAAARFDIIVWRPMSFPYELEECTRKYWLISQLLDTLTLPRFHELMVYEDKALQYELLRHIGAPAAKTFISHSSQESLDFVENCTYPQVWKYVSSSGSDDVELLRSPRRARHWVNQAFSFTGRRTSYPYVAQKNMVLMQKYIPGSKFDLRVIAIGDHMFGYYRDVPAGEFRASGMGTVRYGALPEDAMELAYSTADALDMTCLAVDMLLSEGEQRYSIIEVAPFSGWPQSTRWSLMVDGQPGVYMRTPVGYVFEPGPCWHQHYALARFLDRHWVQPRLQGRHAVSPQAESTEGPTETSRNMP